MSRQVRQSLLPLLLTLAVAAPLQALAQASAEEDEYRDVVDLSPDDPAPFTLRNVFAPVTGLFLGGPGYWYEKRKLEIETTPSGGVLDLFYVRANFQKRFEQAESPATVLLPKRIDATPRDTVIIRAYAEGYRQKKVSVRVNSRDQRIVIDLEPLPNTLKGFAHRYFGGRSSLTFLLSESPTFRLQDAKDGISLILTQTGMTSEANASIDGTLSPLLSDLYTQQLGEDLVVKIGFAPSSSYGEPKVRSRQSYDAARELHEFTLDFVPADAAQSVVRAREALAQLRTPDVTGCALRFDAGLREQIGEDALARALTPSGSFTDPYFRAAMRRLGEISPDGIVHFTNGAVFRPGVPIELEAALSQAGGAIGYLALLRSFVADLEQPPHRTETLRGLIAPELGSEAFAGFVASAESQQRDCIASR